MDGNTGFLQTVESGNGIAEKMPRRGVCVVIEDLVEPFAGRLADLGGWVLGGLFENAGGECLPPKVFRVLSRWAGKIVGTNGAVGFPGVDERSVEDGCVDGPLMIRRQCCVGDSHGL